MTAPTVNPVKSPYSGTKQKITGTAKPGTKVVVVGGPFAIAPVTVNADGTFSITVSLTQNHENIFYISVQENMGFSDQVEVTIEESAQKAAAYSIHTGEDISAPAAPVITPVTNTVDTYFYTLQGTAEAGGTLYVSGDATDVVKIPASGLFAVSVRLKQNKKNTFHLEVEDKAGNLSPKTVFTITERGETSDENDIRVVIDETAGEDSNAPHIANPFSDIEGNRYAEYIEVLRLQGVLQGYPDGTVRPDAFVNRAELLKMATLSFGLNVLVEAGSSPFIDVPKLSWFARFVETGKEEGVISGYPDNTFKPEQTVNRAEALKIILNSSRTPYNTTPPAEYLFTDVGYGQTNTWYYPYVYFLKKNGIIFGRSDGSIRPSDSMTRGELAEIIVRLQNFLNGQQ